MGIDLRCLNIRKIILALDFQNSQIMLINSKPFPSSYTQGDLIYISFALNCIITVITLFNAFLKSNSGDGKQASDFPIQLVCFFFSPRSSSQESLHIA